MTALSATGRILRTPHHLLLHSNMHIAFVRMRMPAPCAAGSMGTGRRLWQYPRH